MPSQAMNGAAFKSLDAKHVGLLLFSFGDGGLYALVDADGLGAPGVVTVTGVLEAWSSYPRPVQAPWQIPAIHPPGLADMTEQTQDRRIFHRGEA